MQELVALANDVAAAMKAHLAREEQDVLPALRKHLTRGEKHAMVWKSLQALPLRLLERIMPWVALHIGSQVLKPLLCSALQLGTRSYTCARFGRTCTVWVAFSPHFYEYGCLWLCT